MSIVPATEPSPATTTGTAPAADETPLAREGVLTGFPPVNAGAFVPNRDRPLGDGDYSNDRTPAAPDAARPIEGEDES